MDTFDISRKFDTTERIKRFNDTTRNVIRLVDFHILLDVDVIYNLADGEHEATRNFLMGQLKARGIEGFTAKRSLVLKQMETFKLDYRDKKKRQRGTGKEDKTKSVSNTKPKKPESPLRRELRQWGRWLKGKK